MLTRLQHVATHAVVFLNYPPTVLDVLPPLVRRVVEERRRHVCAFHSQTAKQERRQTTPPFFGKVRLGHAQTVLRFEILRLAGVVNLGLSQLVLEESTMVVPLLLFIFRMNVGRIAAVFGILSQQSKGRTLP